MFGQAKKFSSILTQYTLNKTQIKDFPSHIALVFKYPLKFIAKNESKDYFPVTN